MARQDKVRRMSGMCWDWKGHGFVCSQDFGGGLRSASRAKKGTAVDEESAAEVVLLIVRQGSAVGSGTVGNNTTTNDIFTMAGTKWHCKRCKNCGGKRR